MNLNLSGIIELDLHGLRAEEARSRIDKALDSAGVGIYRIRLIHGYHRGTSLYKMIREEYSYGREPRVKRIESGSNEGITELVLKNYF